MVRYLFLISIAFIVSGCSLWSQPTNCIAKRTITATDNFLTTWSWDGFFPALSSTSAVAYPDIKQDKEDYYIADQPLLLWDEQTGTIGVNDQYFSDLQFVDATTLTGESVTVGTLKQTQLSAAELQRIVVFLMDTLIIRTYAHLDADVCLNQETDQTDRYTAHMTVLHRYCTNTCAEDTYDFTVTIDKITGQIVLQ